MIITDLKKKLVFMVDFTQSADSHQVKDNFEIAADIINDLY